ncbi:MAG TPA: type II secretion system protein [Candidatus Saccharimonadales bacterium]|jgi:prepilin-type N-terminal cleavage/methylation domain-containing protein|nr:type II secretion system protein [Candidatus Saccharimonadales bacterium]
MSREGGFTLLEVLLSVSIISLLAGLSVPVYDAFVRRNDLDLTTQTVAATLRRAQTYARSGDYDTAWSVEIQAATVTLFQGTNFGGRNTNYDEPVSIPASITPSGLGEVQFAKFTSAPNTTGNIILTSTANAAKTISINGKGSVDY